ncbi:hypothetical protein B0O99DRAFT_199148 [Bisporella sp. PMI_857]|nr:hypothetical protein B0O99DRAFT_199148 [Bisporella sp. PMI_857]
MDIQPGLAQSGSNSGHQQRISEVNWEQLRPIIKALYIHENKTFAQVADILKETHGFRPTKRQFTKRISKWGFHKNASHEVRRAAIQSLGSSTAKWRETIELEGKIVSGRTLARWKREARHEKRVRAADHNDLSEEVENFNSKDGRNIIPTLDSEGHSSISSQPSNPSHAFQKHWQSVRDIEEHLDLDNWPWAALDIMGSPRLSRMFEELNIRYPNDIEPLSLSRPLSATDHTLWPKEYISMAELRIDPQQSRANEQMMYRRDSLANATLQAPNYQISVPLRYAGMDVFMPSGYYVAPDPFNELYPFPPSFRSETAQGRMVSQSYVAELPLQARITHYETILGKLQKLFPADHSKIISLMEDLADAYHNAERIHDSKNLYDQLLVVRRRLNGPESREALSASIKVCKQLFNTGKFEASSELQQRVHSVILQRFATDHELLLESLYMRAGALEAECQYSEGENVWRQQLQISLAGLGPKHPTTIRVMGHMGRYLSRIPAVFDSTSMASVAENLLRICLQLEVDNGPVVGETRARAFYDKVIVLVTSLRYSQSCAESARVAKSFFKGLQATLGDDHPTALNFNMELGKTYREQGLFQESESWTRKTLDIRLRDKGEFHMSTLDSMHDLARTLVRMDRYEEAIHWLERCLKGSLEVFGPVEYATRECYEDLRDCYVHVKRYQDVSQLCQRMISEITSAKGDTHRHVIDLELWMRQFRKTNDYREDDRKRYQLEHPDMTSTLAEAERARILKVWHTNPS